jgi:hypothetical protein
MAEKVKLGECVCPVETCAKGAEVWTDKNGKPYIKCEHCTMMMRGMSRTYWDWARSKVKAAEPAPAAPIPPASSKPARKFGFA